MVESDLCQIHGRPAGSVPCKAIYGFAFINEHHHSPGSSRCQRSRRILQGDVQRPVAPAAVVVDVQPRRTHHSLHAALNLGLTQPVEPPPPARIAEVVVGSWVTGRSGPIWPMATGRNEADVRGSYGLTMLRRAQFCRSGGTGSCRMEARQAGCSGSASAPGRRRSVSCGRCRRRGGAARTWSRPGGRGRPGVEMAASGPGIAGGAAFRGYRSGVVGRAARTEGGCVAPAPAVRQAAAGRGLRARPVRGRRASW